MRYENEICPGCGKPLLDGEDIVVCPDCATPQHRECYDRTGGCVNGYLHAAEFVWQPSDKTVNEGEAGAPVNPFEGNADEMQGFFCPMCGTRNEPGAYHCINCGAPLPVKANAVPTGIPIMMTGSLLEGCEVTETEEINGEKAGDLALYVRKRAPRFVKKFKAFAEDKSGISWNWSAFLFTPFYFFYRRMSKVGYAFMAIFVAISLFASPQIEKDFEGYFTAAEAYAEEAYDESVSQEETEKAAQAVASEFYKGLEAASHDAILMICVAAFFLSHIFSGLFADKLYYSHTMRNIKALRERCNDEITFRTMLIRVGGVSALNMMCSLFTYYIIGDLLAMLASRIG